MAFSGYDKAAVFLSCIGEEAAAEILKGLDMKTVGRITTHMSRPSLMSKEAIDGIFSEAATKIKNGDTHLGGEEYVKKVLTRGLGESDASRILEMASKESIIDALRWVDPKTLSSFLISEHPQTAALILCLIEPHHAAEVLASFPDDLKSEVATRIATTERIPESAIDELNEVLKGQIDIGKGKGKKLGGPKTIAEILNQTERSTEHLVLEKIETNDSGLADSIRKLMFIFDDLVKLDDRGIQMVLKEVSTDELSIALKTASEGLKEKIFRNMSQRAAQILKEEMEVKGPVKLSDVEKAQQSIVKTARKLEEEGKIVIGGKGGEELVA